jgi:HK97 family phage portal protein
MGLFERLFGSSAAAVPEAAPMPKWRLPVASAGTMISATTPDELDRMLRTGSSAAGQAVTPGTALQVAAVFACVRLISGAVANMPVSVKRRVDDRTRQALTDHPVWSLMNRRPNKWQKPAQFKRMMQGHVLLRGNAYAAKVRGARGDVISLIPLHPDRVAKRQLSDFTCEYTWTPLGGGSQVLQEADVMHLMGLSLDGVTGLSPISYMRETIGEARAMQAHGATTFANGANVTGAFKLPAGRVLADEQKDSLRNQLDEYRSGGARDGKVIILEDGLEFERMALTAEDTQWIDARKFSRGDIAMFFGVPPHMIGDTDKGTSWGTGLETQGQAFVTFTLEDHLTMWEEAIGADLIDWDANPDIYARFNRNALVRGDIAARWEAYVKAMQWGVYSPNDVRQLEDENPRDGGDVYYDPPNTAGTPGQGGNSNVAA